MLRGLDEAAWERPTSAGTWNVRQVAAHLLHGDLRELSSPRDAAAGAANTRSFAEIVEVIDVDNARGVEFLATLSPRVITDLLDVTGRQVARLVAGLRPDEPAATNVAWAGEQVSLNWADVGREFTERWHHQMHIRDAVGAPGLTSRRWIEPVLRLAVLALRRSYRAVDAESGTGVVFRVHGAWRHAWSIVRDDVRWDLFDGTHDRPAAVVSMDTETAWRSLFGFSSVEDTRNRAVVQGTLAMAQPIMRTRSVMIREAADER